MKKVGLITGATSGIGKELARIHAKAGGDLVLVARSESQLNLVKEEFEKTYKVEVAIFPIDLCNDGAAQKVFEFTKQEQIEVTYLFNNAGFGGHGKFFERNLQDDLNMIQLNVAALVALTHFYLPGMIARKQGKILNTSSTAGFIPGPLQATYYATKAFVNSFSLGISQELKGTGVSVTALCPGPVKTNFENVAGMGGSDMFAKGAHPADTANVGYTAMLKGDLIAISDSKLKFMIRFMLPFMSNRIILKMVEKLQTMK